MGSSGVAHSIAWLPYWKEKEIVMVGLGGGSFVGMMLGVSNIMCERNLSCWFRVVVDYCLLSISI